ncbi:MAG: heparinase II/III family protein, partial [Saprospiraceae bacterium]|nr:heparinase II/III family protein [Saprospiraceae bacterium]
MLFKTLYFLIIISLWHNRFSQNVEIPSNKPGAEIMADSSNPVVLEPWTYQDNFEDRDLGAWASYPLWQDIAYNQNFRVNEIVPGDPNISIVQKVTPYTVVDNYSGAQKLLDMYLVPGATLSFRYFLKTNQDCEFYKARFAAGSYGKLDVTLQHPEANKWHQVTLDYDDFVKENPEIEGNEKIRIYALAFLAKFPNADPDMPIYFGLDDVILKAARLAAFQFLEPDVYKLPEFKTYIPKQHYAVGSEFRLSGKWSAETKEVTLEIASYPDGSELVHQEILTKKEELWSLKPFILDVSEGLYLGTLQAHSRGHQISETQFTIHVVSKDIAGLHPRLLFDPEKKKEINKRFGEVRFKRVYEDISKNAKEQRTKIPVESLHFDLDQFPDEEWLPTWDAWGARIYHTGTALRLNARAYAFHRDLEAGEYVKQVLLRLASWPNWTHPWQTKRGRFSEHRTGSWSHRVAEAYDLIYDLMDPDERVLVRQAIMKNIVEGVHRTYVHNDNITAATSNWLAMTVGGSLMCLSAIFQDGEDTQHIEPYFTGAIMKLNRFVNKVTDSNDGAWGEGYGYNNYSFSNLSYSLPSIENVFGIDLSKPLVGTYNEYIWAGWIKNKRWFEYGDSRGNLTSARNWAYLLHKYKEPRLSWFYHFLKENKSNYVANNQPSETQKRNQGTDSEAYEDVIFNTAHIPQENPFEENPVKLFREVGTTVFKSGWQPDDFVFVMRSGPGYNHQHLDQGSFWLADRGRLFVQERPLSNSHYYDDPLYESWLTQPVGHSTILINGNHQSQRVGDHAGFAPGFDDHAYVSHFLDGQKASFSTGNIGKLYWGEVSELSRNVLYIKPRAILMLDVAVPSKGNTDITLLYQTARLAD